MTERKTEHAIGFQVFQLPEGDGQLTEDNYSKVLFFLETKFIFLFAFYFRAPFSIFAADREDEPLHQPEGSESEAGPAPRCLLHRANHLPTWRGGPVPCQDFRREGLGDQKWGCR